MFSIELKMRLAKHMNEQHNDESLSSSTTTKCASRENKQKAITPIRRT